MGASQNIWRGMAEGNGGAGLGEGMAIVRDSPDRMEEVVTGGRLGLL